MLGVRPESLEYTTLVSHGAPPPFLPPDVPRGTGRLSLCPTKSHRRSYDYFWGPTTQWHHRSTITVSRVKRDS